MTAGHKSAGDLLYVFSSRDGSQTGPSCVIDAHGVLPVRYKTFKVPADKAISFYTPWGVAVAYKTMVKHPTDPVRRYNTSRVLLGIATGTVDAVETYREDSKCPDYELSKISASTSKITNYVSERSSVTYADYEKMLDDTPSACDLVTIRRGSIWSDITLQEALAALKTAGYGYANIHCSFCRVESLERFTAKSYDPVTKQYV